MLDEANIDTMIREAAIYELCNRMQPGICIDVNIPYSMTDWGGAIIQVKKRTKIDEGWQRNFSRQCYRLLSRNLKDWLSQCQEDVDMYDMDDIMWNLTTRVNPHTDILNPLPGGQRSDFMPAERMTAWEGGTASNTVFEGGMGIDATVPFGFESDFLRPQYPVDKVNPSDFFSKGEISMMKSRMHGWVNSLAKYGR